MPMDKTLERDLAKSVAKLNKARAVERQAWAETKALMKQAHESDSGATFGEISKIVGITKGRVYQIITGNRGGKPPAKTNGKPAKKPAKAKAKVSA